MKENYLNNYAKLAKHCMKGKLSLTLATLVSLLITGQVAMGAIESTDLSGGETHNVLSLEEYTDTGFNVLGGINEIIFNNNEALVNVHSEYYEHSNNDNNYDDDDATGVNITDENKLTIKYQENVNENGFNIYANNTATGIKGNVSGSYDLTNEVDFYVNSREGSSHGINIFTTGKAGSSSINNSGNISTNYNNIDNRMSTLSKSSTGIETYIMEDDREDSISNSGNIFINSRSEDTGIKTTTDGNNNKSIVENSGNINLVSQYGKSTGISSLTKGQGNDLKITNKGNITVGSIDRDFERNINKAIQETENRNDFVGINADINGTENKLTVVNENLVNVNNNSHSQDYGSSNIVGINTDINGTENKLTVINENLVNVNNNSYGQDYDRSNVNAQANTSLNSNTVGIDTAINGNSNELKISNNGDINSHSFSVARADAVGYISGDFETNVRAQAQAQAYAYAKGVNAEIDGDWNVVNITNEVEGNITATADTYATANADIDDSGALAEVARVETDLKTAQTALNNATENELEAAQADLKTAQSDLDNAQSNLTAAISTAEDNAQANANSTANGIEANLKGNNNTIIVANKGKISAEANANAYANDSYENIYAAGIDVDGDGDNNTTIVMNSGTITATAEDEAYGVYAVVNGLDTDTTLTNAGSITAIATSEGKAFAAGVYASLDNSLNEPIQTVATSTNIETEKTTDEEDTNILKVNNSGTITAEGKYIAGIYTDLDGQNITTITRNTGDITATGTFAAGISNGFMMEGGAQIDNSKVTLTNSETGSIKATGVNTIIGMDSRLTGENNTVIMANAGTIDVDSTGRIEDAQATGIYADLDMDNTSLEEGSIDEFPSTILANSGSITADSYGNATGIYANVRGDNTVTDIINSGNMTMTSTGADANGVEADVLGNNNTFTVTNTDIITANAINPDSDSILDSNEIAGTNADNTDRNASGINTNINGNNIITKITNDINGSITATAEDEAYGVYAVINGLDTDTTLTNAGSITAIVTGESGTAGIYASLNNSLDKSLQNMSLTLLDTSLDEPIETIIDTLKIDNSGTISAEGVSVAGVYTNLEGQNITATIDNTGNIIAEGIYAAGISNGFMMEGGAQIDNSEVTLTNSETGSIKATGVNTTIGMDSRVAGENNAVAMANAGTIDVDSTGGNEDAQATGIYADLKGNNTTTTLENFGTITANSYDDAVGIGTDIYGNNTITAINNLGNMNLTSAGDDAYGVEVSVRGTNTGTIITNSGTITALSDETTGEASNGFNKANGIYANLDANNETGESSTFTIENSGNIAATANETDNSDTEVYAVGVEADLDGDYIVTDITNSGNIVAQSEEDSSGIYANVNGNKTTTSITNEIAGNITVTAGDDAYGIEAKLYQGYNEKFMEFGEGKVDPADTLTLTNSGSITATATGEGKAFAAGVYALLDNSLNEPIQMVATSTNIETEKTTDEEDTNILKVNNSGTITAEGKYIAGIYTDLDGQNITTITRNTGDITANGTFAAGISNGFMMDDRAQIDNSKVTLTNSEGAKITANGASAVGLAVGINGDENEITVANSGAMDITASHKAVGISAMAKSGVLENGFSEIALTNEAGGSINITVGSSETEVSPASTREKDSDFEDATYGMFATGENSDISLDNQGDITINSLGTKNIVVGMSALDKVTVNEPSTVAVNNSGTITIDTQGGLAVGMTGEKTREMIANRSLQNEDASQDTLINNSGTIRITSANAGEMEGRMSVGMTSEADMKRLSENTYKTNLNNSGDIILDGNTSLGVVALSGDAANNGDIWIKGNKSFGMRSGFMSETGGKLDNNGEITVIGDGSIGMTSSAGDMTNSGTITVAGINSYGIYTDTAKVTANNTGTISAYGNDSAGVMVDGEAQFTNAGTISAYGNNSAGVMVDGKAQFTNIGTISAYRNDSAGVKVYGDGEFTNAGTISASNGVIGVDMSEADTTYFVNKGTITSDNVAVMMNLGADSRVILQGKDTSITGIVNGGKNSENTVVLRDGADIGFETKNISIISVESGESHILGGTTMALNTAVNAAEKITPAEGTTLVIDEGATVQININADQETSRLDAETIDVDGKILVDTSFLEMGRATEYHFEHVFTGDVTDESWDNILVDSYTWETSEGSLIIKKSDYASLTNIGELKGVAEVLEANKLSLGFETVLDELDKTTTKAEYEDALGQMSGNMYASFPAITLQTTKIFEKNVKNFINLDSEKEIQQHISIIGESGDFSKNDKNEGFEYQSAGFVGATEKNLSKKNAVGLSYGYADTDTDFEDAANNSADIKTAHAGVYHEYQGETWQIATRAAYEYNNVEAERNIDFNDLDYKLDSEFDVNSLTIGTELSTVYNAGKWEFKPLIGIAYSYIDQDEIKESGGESMNMTIGSETYTSIRSEVGIRVDRKLSFGLVYGEASWNHEYGNVYDDISATLQGAPSDGYGIYGLQDMEETYTAGAGIIIGDEEGLSCNIGYSFSGNSEFKEHMVSTGVSYTF